MKKRKESTMDLAADKNLGVLLARLAELEQRVKKLEAERDAALANGPAHVSGQILTSAPAKEPASALLPAAASVAPTLAPTIVGKASAAPLVTEPAGPPKEEISEEILMIISAAVAAFLGKRAHLRQIRLVSTGAWAQQGRVSIMASHRWAERR